MTDELYTQSQVDALVQAANEAALRELIEKWRKDLPEGPYANMDVDLEDMTLARCCKDAESLIPEPSALAARLAEARLEEAIMWNDSCDDCTEMPPQFFNWSAERIAKLRRAVKGESNA